MKQKWLVKDQLKDQLIWLVAIFGKIIQYTYLHTRVGAIHELPLRYVDYQMINSYISLKFQGVKRSPLINYL